MNIRQNHDERELLMRITETVETLLRFVEGSVVAQMFKISVEILNANQVLIVRFPLYKTTFNSTTKIPPVFGIHDTYYPYTTIDITRLN